jgi:hypothetical protein
MSCINKSDKKYQLLVRDYGDYVAELLTRLNTPKDREFIIPTLEQSEELIKNQKNKQYEDFKDFLVNSDIINKETIKSKLKGVIWESKEFEKLLVTTGFTSSRSLALNGLENRHILSNNIITLQNINKILPLFIIKPSIGRTDRYIVEIDENVLETLQNSKIEKNSIETSELKIPGEPKILKDTYRRLSENDYINQTYFKDAESMPVKTILEQIIDKTYLHGELAKKFLPYIKENMTISLVDNIDKQIIWTKSGKFEVFPVGIAYADINKILIKRNTNENETTILHEILHLLTYHQLRQNKKVNKDFQKLFDYAINNLPQSDYYSLSNLDEFIVGLFTNSVLIRDLQKIPPLKGIKKYKNLFEELLNFILEVFDIKKSNNFYEQAISVASHIVGSKTKTIKQEKLEKEKEKVLKIINEQEKISDLSEEFDPLPEDFFNEQEIISTDNNFQKDIDYFNGDQELMDQENAPERYLAITPQDESTNKVAKEILSKGDQLKEINKSEVTPLDNQLSLNLTEEETNNQNLTLRVIDILETKEADFAFSEGLNNNSLNKILETLKIPKSQINAIMENMSKSEIEPIKDKDITYTNEEGLSCAEAGLKSSNFTKGGKWEIIKVLKGPAHAQGGIDIEIGNGGVKLSNKQGEFKAKNGLIIPKAEKGLTVSEIYTAKTGKDWNTAKQEGLTSGSYEDNITLRQKLLSGEFDGKQSTISKQNTNIQNTKLLQNQDYTKAKNFNEAFSIAREQLGANQIFEYQGRKYGTNIKGEKFEPNDEVLEKNNLNKPEVKERLQTQNKLTGSVYSTKKTSKLEPEYKNWEEIRQRNTEINKMDQAEIIKQFHKGTSEQYVIVDKKRDKMHLYEGDKEIASYNIGTGENIGDQQTKTVVKDGKVLWEEGNKMTGAGIYTASNVNPKNNHYSDAPTWNFYNENGIEVPMALHSSFGNRTSKIKDNDETNNRLSNGCINGVCQDLRDLYTKGFNKGEKLYVLPDDDNNKYEISNGKIIFKSKDSEVNKTINTLQYKPIKIEYNKEFRESYPEVKNMAQAIVNNKKSLMKDLKINGDLFNDIAEISLGVAGQETEYGTSLKYKLKTEGVQDILKSITNNNSYNSKGITQIKFDGMNKEVKVLFDKYGITKDNLNKGDKAIIAQIILFSYAYNNELPAYQKVMKELNVSPIEALLYLNQGKSGELRNKTATPEKNIYIKNVKTFSKNFTLKELN